MSFTQHCNEIFNKAINDYHVYDNIDRPINNPFEKKNIEVDKPEILLSKTQNLDSYLYNHYNIDKDSEKKLIKHFDSLRK